MNNKVVRYIGGAVALGVLAVVAFLVYIWFSGGSGEPSGETIAPTLPPRATEVAQSAATEVATVESATTEEAATTGTDTTASGTGSTSTGSDTTAAAASTGTVQFSIVPAESELRFSLDETLRGQRITVVGTTDQVAGLIEIDRTNPANSRIGTIRMNLRTLETDQEFRNRAIRSEILLTSQDEYEFSDFVPTEVTGLPASIQIGTPFTFSVRGDLTIRGEPRDITFEVTVTPVAEDRIEGLAQATVRWGDWGIDTPSAPGVADIEEEVLLELEFVATPATTGSPARVGRTAAKTVSTSPQTEVAQGGKTPTPAPSDIALFSIVQDESEVRFSLDEDLRGNRVTVVGTTDQVAGLIEIDRANPANSRIGAIRINMRTLETDQEMRNRAIRSRILETAKDEYEFSEFVPTEITGLPTEPVELGDSYTFTVLGELTIKGEPREVEFEVTITAISDTRIEGLAQATVRWDEWDIDTPSAPGVANVEEEVLLEIEFVAEVED